MLVCAVLLATIACTAGSVNGLKTNKGSGDVNNSGDIDSMDYVLVKRAYFGTFNLTGEQIEAGDVNTSGDIDSMDYVLIKRAYFGTFPINTPESDNSGDIPESDGGNGAPEEKVDTVVSRGKEYKTSTPAAEQYPDAYSSELTNGANPEIYSYAHSSLAGYATRRLVVTIDLGKVYSEIHTFAANVYLDDQAGISSSISVVVSYSDNQTDWKSGATLAYTKAVKLGEINRAEKELRIPVSARYIRFELVGNAGWIFIDECEVVAKTAASERIDYAASVYKTYNNLGTVSPQTNGASPDEAYPEQCISQGASYTVDTTPVTRFGDTGKKLTDGSVGTLYESGSWVGYKGGKPITIKIDLGATANDISSVGIICFAKEEVGIFQPTAFDITAISENGKSEIVGRLYGVPKHEDGRKEFLFTTGKTFSARYIQITVYTIENATHFIGEVSVYAHRKESYGLYPPVKIENGALDWETQSSAYENLLLGKEYQIDLVGSVSTNQYESNTRVGSTVINDGAFATHFDIHNGQYFKLCQGERRSFIFDLTRLSTVDKFTIGFCHMESWAIYSPASVPVVVSADGINWYKVGSIEVKETNLEGIRRGELVLPEGVRARYVAFMVDTIIWTGVDEIEAFGSKNSLGIDAATKYEQIYKKHEQANSRKEPSESLLGGTEHLCLLYHSENLGSYSVEDLIPYLAYVDREGNILDTLFDGFLFLHDTGSMPSGATAFEGSVKSDWDWCINDMFTQGTNIYALEEAAGRVKSALSLPEDYKYKVTVTLYEPGKDVTDFGDVDGDGISESFAIYEDCIKAYNWYINEIESRFAAAGFKNIELVGYYWWNEGINTGNTMLKKTMNAISDMLDERGRSFFWIPYHCAPGFSSWADYGFDIACMQPNYVFNAETPYRNLINNEKFTKMYGMGVEIEIFESSLADKLFFKKYMQYLALGAESGYMTDTVNMYYQSKYVFKLAAYSDSYMARTVYDTTYHYIKGDLKNVPERLNDMRFSATANNVFVGSVGFGEEKLREFKISALPEHGTVTFDADGNFYYFPEKDYKGEIRFSFVYNEYLSWSEPSEVVITLN